MMPTQRTIAEATDEGALRSAVRSATAAQVDVERLGAALSARAEAEGLLDVAFTRIDSPLGPLLAAATDVGLVQVGWANSDHDGLLERLAERIGPRVLESPGRFDELRRELDQYFAGNRREFEVPLDWRLSGGFVRSVLEQTARIPFGETRTYAEIAGLAGSPRAYRAAGSALGANPIPIVVPCHRVLRSGGGLGGYGGGLEVKERLLELEGALP